MAETAFFTYSSCALKQEHNNEVFTSQLAIALNGTVKASNIAPHGNLRPILARCVFCVASLDEFSTKHKLNIFSKSNAFLKLSNAFLWTRFKDINLFSKKKSELSMRSKVKGSTIVNNDLSENSRSIVELFLGNSFERLLNGPHAFVQHVLRDVDERHLVACCGCNLQTSRMSYFLSSFTKDVSDIEGSLTFEIDLCNASAHQATANDGNLSDHTGHVFVSF
jgi:hypothetical protein